MRTQNTPLLFLLLFLLPGCSSPGRAELVGPWSQSPESGRLEKDVSWLADDAREGRRAGTPGAAEAAEWIAARMAELGLEPAGTDGYFQSFEVALPPRDGGGSSVGEATGAELLVPLFCSARGRARGPVAFCGYGITAPDLGWDDYKSRDVSGAIVVVLRGTPPESFLPEPEPAEDGPEEVPNPHGGTPVTENASWAGYGSIFHKVVEAKRRGAAAVLIANHPAKDDGMLGFDAGRTAEAKIPALMIASVLAERIVPSFGERVRLLDADGMVRVSREADPAVEVFSDVVRERSVARNVIGRLSGEGSTKTVVLGAHFDHLGYGGPGSLAKDVRAIHNGADDNASGTAVVLEVARCMVSAPPPRSDVVFALWSAEELGLLGSEYWAKHPTMDLESVRANVNLDMVGRVAEGKLQVLGAGTAEAFVPILEACEVRAGLDLEVSLSGQGLGGSDHQTFLKRSIPALHFFSGVHGEYHRPEDDAALFEAAGAAKVAVLTLTVIQGIQGAEELDFVAVTEESNQQGGFRTRFGSIPDYAYDGPGFRLDGTSAGGPAERAGLLRGDILLKIDDFELDGLGDFMYVLNSHKPGDVLRVVFERDSEQAEVLVTLESSQVE